MNQDQRKFLLARVEQTYKEEHRRLELKKPKEPSLNNYLVAAALDGSMQMKSIDDIRAHIKGMVLKLGNKETLIHETQSRYSGYNESEKPYHSINLLASEVFIYPAAYIKAHEIYEAEKEAVEAEIDKLINQKETLLLKIQIGSNAVLDNLVTHVDNMIDIGFLNSKLMLTKGEEDK